MNYRPMCALASTASDVEAAALVARAAHQMVIFGDSRFHDFQAKIGGLRRRPDSQLCGLPSFSSHDR